LDTLLLLLLFQAPIAGNWEAYNTVDNQGELVGAAFSR
jgi:hypothetical protein